MTARKERIAKLLDTSCNNEMVAIAEDISANNTKNKAIVNKKEIIKHG